MSMLYYESSFSPCDYLGLMGLVDDLKSSLELAKRIVETTEMANPVKVTYAIKQLAKEAAAGKERGERGGGGEGMKEGEGRERGRGGWEGREGRGEEGRAHNKILIFPGHNA